MGDDAVQPDIEAAWARPWPLWPVWPLSIGGVALLVVGLLASGMAASGLRPSVDPGVFVIMAVAGATALCAGLIYQALRSIRLRRHLPPLRYRGPSVLLLLALAVAATAVLALPFAADAMAIFAGAGEPSALGSLALLTATQLGLVAVTTALVLAPRALAGASWLGARPLEALGLGVLVGLGAWFVSSALQVAIAIGLGAAGLAPDPQPVQQALAAVDPLVLVVAVAIVAPIAEELFFRGVVFNAWRREYGRRRAYLGSAALFAAIHASLLTLLPVFLLGLVLAWVYERTGSLISAIAMHAVVNGISLMLALLIRFEIIPLPQPAF